MEAIHNITTEATIKTEQIRPAATAVDIKKKTFPLFDEHYRYGVLIGVLLLIGTLGGTAIAVGAVTQVDHMILLVVPMMLTLSLSLAVAPMRYIVIAAAATVFIDVCMILYYVL